MNELHSVAGVVGAGEPVASASGAVILLHGRGDSAQGILQLVPSIELTGLAYLAPNASGQTWYPHSFLAPLESNQPWLDSALQVVGELVDRLVGQGLPRERIVLLGFSQGACLASEYAARNGSRYGGVVALSGGLIGPEDTARDYSGDLAGTPIFLGCSDIDPHVPVARVHHSAAVLEGLGAQVEKRLYPGMGHTVNEDEIGWVRALLTAMV